MSEFALTEARAERDLGLGLVELAHGDFVGSMRELARRIARAKGSVTADDLRRWALANNVEAPHQNCWGAIFRTAEWTCVGRRASRKVSNHAREIRVWALKEAA